MTARSESGRLGGSKLRVPWGRLGQRHRQRLLHCPAGLSLSVACRDAAPAVRSLPEKTHMTRHPNYAARLAPLGLVLGFALGWHSACAQMRTFVSAAGNDANICTATSPCRTFQRAHDVGATGAEIEVIDPAGYGPLIISKSVSIQGHGVAGITQTSSNGVAVSIQGGSTAVVVLRGLVIEGGGLGFRGIHFQSGGSLDISDTIVHHFAGDGIIVAPTTDSKVSIRDTVANGNGGSGIYFFPQSRSGKKLSRMSRL